MATDRKGIQSRPVGRSMQRNWSHLQGSVGQDVQRRQRHLHLLAHSKGTDSGSNRLHRGWWPHRILDLLGARPGERMGH